METLNLYQNNVAYDFEMFAPAPKPEREAPIIDYPERKAKDKLGKERDAKRKSSKVSAILLATVMLVALFANVLSRAQISQAQMQISKQEKAISKLDSEITRLQCNLQSVMTYETIEAGAIALGMQKMERSQVKYVNINEEDSLPETDDATQNEVVCIADTTQ